MTKFKTGDIAKVAGKDIVGRVIETFDKTTKMMTCEGEKTFPNGMLELIGAFNRAKLVVHPEQLQLRAYFAKCEAAHPAAAKYFRQIAEAMVALVHWHPGDDTWHFLEKPEDGSNLAIRVPTGKTSGIFHLSCHGETIRIELEGKKKCPGELSEYFPLKGSYVKGRKKEISGAELNDQYVKEYIEVLKKVYIHNTGV